MTVYRWVLRSTALLADAAKPCRHAVGCRWQVDETSVKVAGQWRYAYRAVDQSDRVIDVFVSARRDAKAARRFFERAIGATNLTPVEVVTDQAPVYPAVVEELLPAAWHRTEQYANNRVEADYGRLKARLRPMRELKRDHSARVIIAGHAFVQNLRQGHYELAVEEPTNRRPAVAFDELVLAISSKQTRRLQLAWAAQRNSALAATIVSAGGRYFPHSWPAVVVGWLIGWFRFILAARTRSCRGHRSRCWSWRPCLA